MEQLKFYKYSAIFLFILNLSIIAFFLITKPKRHLENNRNLIKILKLDKTQNATFLQYANTHKALMKDFNEAQRVILKTYFQTLTDTTNIAITDSLLTEVQSLEKQKIESTYEHLKEIKDILNEDQIPHYQEFMNRIHTVILAESKKTKKSEGF